MSSFDARAAEWDKNARRRAVAKAVAEFTKPFVKPGAKILDFGCGTGLVSYHFADTAAKIVGVDSSQKMRREFAKKSPGPHIYATESMPNETFDLIISSMTLHHIEDIAALAREFVARLKPGGAVVVADLEKEDGTFHDSGNEGVYHFGFEPKELAEVFKAAGLEPIGWERVYTIQKHRPFGVFCLSARRSP